MLIPLIILFIIAYLAGHLFEKLKLPALLAYMITGIGFSPYVFEFLQIKGTASQLFLTHEIILNSAPVRELALFIILFRAGLGLDRTGLKFHGTKAVSLSILPCLIEAAAVGGLSVLIFNLPLIEAMIIGFVIAAVSPAVIVPQMLELQKQQMGTDKKIPTLILAGSTIDDILAISGFGICIALLATDNSEDWRKMALNVPLSVASGAITGHLLAKPLTSALKHSGMPAFLNILLLLAIAFSFKFIENSRIPFSHLIAILSLALSIQAHDYEFSETLSKWFSKLWSIAVVILFILIGAMVNPATVVNAGLYGLLILLCGLLARSLGVLLSLRGSTLNNRERLFCVIAYIPKATVQATIGGICVSLFLKGKIWLYNGLETGDLIVAMAALSILFTAPLGALGIRIFSKKLLNTDKVNSSDIS